MPILAANLRVLAGRYPALLELLRARQAEAKRFRVATERGQQALVARLEDGTEVLVSQAAPAGPASLAGPAGPPGARSGRPVLCLGFGLGAHVRQLLDAVGPEGRVDVLLLHPASLLAVLAAVDLADLLADPRCNLLWGDLAAVSRELRQRFAEDAFVVYQVPSLRVADATLRPLVGAIERLRHERARVDVAGGLLQENYRRNLPWVAASRGLDELAGLLAGRPAVVIAAGPSLDRNVEELRQVQGRVPLLCVDTAARRVLQAGVRPDLLLTTDGNRASLRHFSGLDPTLPLAFLPSAFSGVLDAHRGPKIVALPRGDRLAELLQALSGKGTVGVAGTVAYFGLEVARRLGCDPLIFVGLDLALTGGRSHCDGASSPPAARRRQMVASVDGSRVETTSALDRFRQAIELRIAEDPGCTFVDATEGGARVHGTVVCTLREARERWGRELSPLPPIFDGPAPAPRTPPRAWQEAWRAIYSEPWSETGNAPLAADAPGRSQAL